jgi:hypothetical protein
LEISVKTLNPRAHIEVCSLIKQFECQILKSDIFNDVEAYGIFTLDVEKEFVDTFILLPNVITSWE